MALIDKIYDNTFPGLEKALDLSWRRNQVISANIANAETPQYRAADLNFAGELERAYGQQAESLMRTNSQHLDITSNSSAHLIPDLAGATKGDGNNVDLDIEMGQLAFNSGKYTTTAALLRKKTTILKFLMRDGTR